MSLLPFLPLAVESWAADTWHLSRAERGLYMDLLCLMWRTPECRVPNEIDWIARKLRCLDAEIPMLESIIAEFCQSTGNWLTQNRLLREYKRACKTSSRRSDSAKARWNKGKGECKSNAPTPTPTPTPTKKRDSKESPKERGSRLPEDWQPDEVAVARAGLIDEIKTLIPAEDRKAWTDGVVASFCDYWHSKTGAGATKLDWQMTFNTWLRKELQNVRQRNWTTARWQEARAR